MAGRSHRSIDRPRRGRNRPCPLCGRTVAYLLTCRCGFAMCQDCNAENAWGLTCNSLTWTCPDCGELRSY